MTNQLVALEVRTNFSSRTPFVLPLHVRLSAGFFVFLRPGSCFPLFARFSPVRVSRRFYLNLSLITRRKMTTPCSGSRVKALRATCVCPPSQRSSVDLRHRTRKVWPTLHGQLGTMSSPSSSNSFTAASTLLPSPGQYHASPKTSADPLPCDQAVLVKECMPAFSQERPSFLEDSLSPHEDWAEATSNPSPPTLLENNAPSSPKVSVPILREVDLPPSSDPDYDSGEERNHDVSKEDALTTDEDAFTTEDHTAVPSTPSSPPASTASDDAIAVVLLTPGASVPKYIVRRRDPDYGHLFPALLQQACTFPTVCRDVYSCDPPHSMSVTGSAPASSSSAIASAVAQPAVLASVLSPDSAGNAEAISSHAETVIPQAGETEATEGVQNGNGLVRGASEDHA